MNSILEFIVSHEKKLISYLLMTLSFAVTFRLFTYKPFLNWISPAVEGSDNKASGIRIISVIMTFLVVFLVFQSQVRQRVVNEWMFNSLLIFIAAVWGIVFAPRIAGKDSTPKPEKKEDEN